MYIHKKCGNEIQAKSVVHEYATVTNLEHNYIECGDVMESVVEETVLWCETCCEEVSFENVEEQPSD